MIPNNSKKKKILAVASSGGHWTQLLRLRPSFKDHHIIYASTNKSNYYDVIDYKFYYFTDANRKTFWNFFRMFFQLIKIISTERPSIIITTGSAPGLVSLIVGKLFSTKNVWIDSIANVEKMSTSGKLASHFADLYLTQWPELSRREGPLFQGSTL